MGSEQAHRHTNRLAGETSPYLLQHAHNPVDWYPWGEEALERARIEEKPIFLSVGYAACHWCHVMERESFENDDTARFLNEHFVAVKVDREERPDIDSIYMEAVQQMTGSGGWPMSVFLTPAGRPFYGGTYFPGSARHGLPSFTQVLEGVSAAWLERRDEVEQSGAALTSAIGREVRTPEDASAVSRATLDAALTGLESAFDARNGGWGGAPKFPQPMTVELLLRICTLSGDESALAMARRTLDAMAVGGIYDQLGGGFARYATDSIWLVPHFEKMLYDNAQLARVYVHAWQVTRDPRYRRVAQETVDFMLRELRVDGGFAASLDADTLGIEGGTYVWNEADIDSVLGDATATFKQAYGVSSNGNWEGTNILTRIAPEEADDGLADSRALLLAERYRRPQPARDDKALAAWNGLAIAALADAARAFDRPDLSAAATAVAEEVSVNLLDGSGRLHRSWKDGRALHAGVLEDHADLAEGLLALYEATFDERWFSLARQLMDVVLEHFVDPAGGFFDTADDHEALIARPRSLQDNALPSGGAMATTVLLRLAALTGDERYSSAAERALGQVAPLGARYPTAFAQWLNAVAFSVGQPIEIAISGTPDAADCHALLDVVRAEFRPFAVVAVGDSGTSAVPLLHERPQLDGRATAYVCRQFACRAPVDSPTDLAAQIASRP